MVAGRQPTAPQNSGATTGRSIDTIVQATAPMASSSQDLGQRMMRQIGV